MNWQQIWNKIEETLMTTMKRLALTLADSTYALLEDWADQQGRPTTSLATFILERYVADAIESGVYHPRLTISMPTSDLPKGVAKSQSSEGSET